jgi:predicted HicB family RNase H-like nuclease
MSTQKKTATLTIRISPELKALAEQAAASDSRSMASLIEKLLRDHTRTSNEPRR